MESFILRKKSQLAIVFLSLFFCGCTDNDYDFDQVDLTLGFGGEELLLPGSSTDTIKLSDVLELNNSETVVIKPNGDYVFEQKGSYVEPAKPMIDKIMVARQTTTSSDLNIDLASMLPNMAKGRKQLPIVELPLDVNGKVYGFEYAGNKPKEVVALDKADVYAAISLNLEFSQMLSSLVPVIERLDIDLPRYMNLDNVVFSGRYELLGTRLSLFDIATNEPVALGVEIVGLDFIGGNSDMGQLVISDGKIEVDGSINLGVKATAQYDLASGIVPKVEDIYIRSHIEMSDFEIRGATGRFAPNISLDNLGDINVTGIPQFLTGGNVVVDLYNPQIHLTLDNDMDVAGFISGTIVSEKNGKMLASVDVPEMKVNANGKTTMCICRKANEIELGLFDVVAEIPNLSDLIKTIPDKIIFSAAARVDETKTCSFELGKQYTIQPSYKIEAPITFGEDATIVYEDSIDDMNKDLQDIQLSENAFVQVNANIENRAPVYLSVTAEAIGVNGKVLDGIKVDVKNTVIASADGENSVVTPLEVVIMQSEKKALNQLEKLRFTIVGKAKSPDGNNSVVGKTLNSEKHFLIARDIEIKLVGKVITDLN